jgi:putative FmdB family regulatory protein
LEGAVPIYEYRCSSCGFQKEYLRKVSDPLLSICPECSKATFGKMLTSAGFQLKGGGWYATDFKHSGAGPAAKSADQSGAAAKTESKTETTSEKKSEGKSESKTADQPAAAKAAVTPASTAKAE